MNKKSKQVKTGPNGHHPHKSTWNQSFPRRKPGRRPRGFREFVFGDEPRENFYERGSCLESADDVLQMDASNW